MHLVQILLPVTVDGEPVPRDHFRAVTRELTDRFGGLTAYTRAPASGLWQSPTGSTTADEVVVYEVMVSDLDRAWWSDYRRALEVRFRQEEIVLRVQAIERL